MSVEHTPQKTSAIETLRSNANKPITRATRDKNPKVLAFISAGDEFVQYCNKFRMTPLEDNTESLLQIKTKRLNDMWQKFATAYDAAKNLDELDVPEGFKLIASNKFYDGIDTFELTQAQMADQLKMLQPPPVLSIAQPQHSVTAQPIDSGNFLKVPPCDTEIFYGTYEDWPSFRDMFTAVYINHPKLTQAQKLYHLRYKTKGKALEIVKNFPLSDDNFQLAWDALKIRYENRRMLVDNQIKILMNLPKVHPETSEAIQKLQNTVNNCLAILKTQSVSTDSWDPILIHLCCSKLPETTLSLWEQSLTSRKELPKWSQLDDFLTTRYEVVERLQSMQVSTPKTQFQPQSQRQFPLNTQPQLSRPQNATHRADLLGKTACKVCNAQHPVKSCQQFLNMSVADRIKVIKNARMCENCLAYSHSSAQCQSKHTCTYCQKRHHSLLHFPQKNAKQAVANVALSAPSEPTTSVELPCCSHQAQQSLHSCSNNQILLPTAIISIEHKGEQFRARALIDQGSQRTFITSKMQNRLQIPYEHSQFEISGMGGRIVQTSNKICTLSIINPCAPARITAKAIVLPQLTKLLPTSHVGIETIECLKRLQLADPNCHKPAQIDVVLGSNVIPQIILNGTDSICGSLLAQKTIFGWIISGPVPESISSFSTQVEQISNETLCTQLRQFWEQEKVPDLQPASPEDSACEKYYVDTTTRSPCGRYIVRLPFKNNFPESVAHAIL